MTWTGLTAQWLTQSSDAPAEAYTNFLGQGMSGVDFNLDGWDDLTVTNSAGELHFMTGGPEGWTTVDLGIEGPVDGRPMSLMWLDIDNDGDRDFIHTSAMSLFAFSPAGTTSNSQLWINEEGTFVNRTEEWGWDVLQDRACTGTAWNDVDLDGDLDVFVSVYAYPCDALWESENALLIQEDGAWLDASVTSGLADGLQPTFQGTWMHLDDDGLMDLFVINDAGFQGDCLMPTNVAYLQTEEGTFEPAPEEWGLSVSMSSMSATVGDPDRDGEEEIFVTNQWFESTVTTFDVVTGAYFDRTPSGFEERSALAGVDTDRWGWCATWVDLDLDGMEDLMIATALFQLAGLFPNDFYYDNYLFQQVTNAEDTVAQFADVLGQWQAGDMPLFALVRLDLNQDQIPDVVGTGNAQFPTVWQNAVGTNNAHQPLTVALCGTHSNSEAIGTRLQLYVDGEVQQRTLRAGEDLYVQHSTRQFFGLGTAAQADSLVITWPSGATVTHHNLSPGAHAFVEGIEEAGVSLVPSGPDSAVVMLSMPPKFTGVEWNGEATGSLQRAVAIGEDLTYRVTWFHGLFEHTGEVDWSALAADGTGCTYPLADNYDISAETDDGSCTFTSLCGPGTTWSIEWQQCVVAQPPCPADLNGSGAVDIPDILTMLEAFGSDCPGQPEDE